MVTEKDYPAYLFFGEPASIEKAAAQIKSKFINPKNESCDLNLFWGDEASSDEVIEALKTAPFASRKRLVVVKRVDALSKADQERLASYLKKPSQYSIALLIGDVSGLIGPLLSEIRNSGKALNFRPSREAKPQSGFALVDAIASGDARAAVTALNRLYAEGKCTVEIIGLLGWYFSKKKKDAKALKMISDSDLNLKTKPTKEIYELEVLIVKLCGLLGKALKNT